MFRLKTDTKIYHLYVIQHIFVHFFEITHEFSIN